MSLVRILFCFCPLVLSQPSSTCSPLSYCPSNCTKPGAFETDGLALLDSHLELLENIGKAVTIMKSFPGVDTDDSLDIHTTFMYLCCVTLDEVINKVYPAMDAVKWTAPNVSYSSAICNHDGSIILEADERSQQEIGAVVSALEDAIIATGVTVVRRSSMQGFHMTIGTVDTSQFPMDDGLAAINAAIPNGTWTKPFPLKNFEFFLPIPHEIKSV